MLKSNGPRVVGVVRLAVAAERRTWVQLLVDGFSVQVRGAGHNLGPQMSNTIFADSGQLLRFETGNGDMQQSVPLYHQRAQLVTQPGALVSVPTDRFGKLQMNHSPPRL